MVLSLFFRQMRLMWLITLSLRESEKSRSNGSDRQKQRQQQKDRRAGRSIQKMFALWCFPAWFSRASSAEPSCGEQHTMLLCPSRLLHSSTAHNSSLWDPRSPWPRLPVPKHCPLLSTHTLSVALAARPRATNS